MDIPRKWKIVGAVSAVGAGALAGSALAAADDGDRPLDGVIRLRDAASAAPGAVTALDEPVQVAFDSADSPPDGLDSPFDGADADDSADSPDDDGTSPDIDGVDSTDTLDSPPDGLDSPVGGADADDSFDSPDDDGTSPDVDGIATPDDVASADGNV